jgi:hypothetical protein
MGCPKLLISNIAAYYTHPLEKVFFLCNQVLITYIHHQIQWELEGIKVIIPKLLSLTPKFLPTIISVNDY